MPSVPGQYAMPRVDGVCPTSLTQISFPVSASSATTRLYMVAMYMTPSITSGVDADCRGVGRPGAVAAPRAGSGLRGAPRREPAKAARPPACRSVHASRGSTRCVVLICLSGEYRCAPASWPCAGQSFSGFGALSHDDRCSGDDDGCGAEAVACYRLAAFQLFQKMNVPRLVDVMISALPSLSRSTTARCEPTPERLWMSSGTNSAPPGAFGFRTVR